MSNNKVMLLSKESSEFRATRDGIFLKIQIDKDNEYKSMAYLVVLSKVLEANIKDFDSLLKEALSKSEKDEIIKNIMTFNNVTIEYDESVNTKNIIDFILQVSSVFTANFFKDRSVEENVARLFKEVEIIDKSQVADKIEVINNMDVYKVLDNFLSNDIN